MSVRGVAVRSHDGSGAATAVAPTVLYALGIPIARDLPSAPLLELFDPQFAARYPRALRRDLRPAVGCARLAHGTAARSGDDRSVEEPGVCEVIIAMLNVSADFEVRNESECWIRRPQLPPEGGSTSELKSDEAITSLASARSRSRPMAARSRRAGS